MIAKQPTAPASARSEPVKDYPYGFMPSNGQPAGSFLHDTELFPNNAKGVPKLFEPLKIRGVEFHNRVLAAPMCQYSSDDGHATMWHTVHLGSLAVRGVGGITVEATAVVPEGRISPEDSGLWKDSQVEPLKPIVAFVHSRGAKIGVQLGHAGRKASTLSPWVGSKMEQVKEFAGVGKGPGGHVAAYEAGGWADDGGYLKGALAICR